MNYSANIVFFLQCCEDLLTLSFIYVCGEKMLHILIIKGIECRRINESNNVSTSYVSSIGTHFKQED